MTKTATGTLRSRAATHKSEKVIEKKKVVVTISLRGEQASEFTYSTWHVCYGSTAEAQDESLARMVAHVRGRQGPEAKVPAGSLLGNLQIGGALGQGHGKMPASSPTTLTKAPSSSRMLSARAFLRSP